MIHRPTEKYALLQPLHSNVAFNRTFFRNIFAITDTVQFTLGGRHDSVELMVNDKFLANGDQSSELDFDELNRTVGLNWNA